MALIVLSLMNALALINAESSCQHESTPILSKCTGCPASYNGKLCASTTRYTDLTRGACGCGQDPNSPNFWSKMDYTSALNCVALDPTNPDLSWCPTNCGLCFKLCATGGTTNGKIPSGTASDTCIVTQVTNRCGDGYKQPNEAQWCRQQMSPSQCVSNHTECNQMYMTNDYGYSAHFDLQDVDGQVHVFLSNTHLSHHDHIVCVTD